MASPFPRVRAFFGSLRESIHPRKAAMAWLKNTARPVRASSRSPGSAGDVVRTSASAAALVHSNVMPLAAIAASASPRSAAPKVSRHPRPRADEASFSAGRTRTYRRPCARSCAANSGNSASTYAATSVDSTTGVAPPAAAGTSQ